MVKTVKRLFILFIIVITPVLIFTSNASLLGKLVPNSDEFSLPVNTGWDYRWENSKESGNLTLPCVVIGREQNRVLWITNILPKQVFDNPTLLIRTSEQYLKVNIDGRLVYSYEPEANNYLLPGSSWHFIKLPQSYEGKKIEISLVSPYKQYSGNINGIYIGCESSLVLKVLMQCGSAFVISCIILLLGIISIFLHYFIKSDEGRFRSLMHLGIFSILSGIWIASESKIVQFFINSPVLIFYLACISLFLVPIPLLLFILTTYKPKNSRLLVGFICFFSVFFVFTSVLQILNNGVFMHLMLFYHVLLLVCTVTVICFSIVEMRKGNNGIKLFFLGCIILCVSSMVDMFDFYFSKVPGLNAQKYLPFGILLFILLLSASLGQYIHEIFNDQIQSKAYKALAYTDILTGIKNRTSFEDKILKINEILEREENVSAVIFDLNNLKVINDSLGHHEGDRLILAASKLICECFNNIGDVYRIGGDEFAVIIVGQIESTVADNLTAFDKKVNEHNKLEGTVKVSIAYGMSSYKKSIDRDLYSVIVRADEEMYTRKKLQKQGGDKLFGVLTEY